MIVGLTYDLRTDYLKRGFTEEETAELDKEETISDIENALNSLGYQTERIGHLENLMTELLKGKRWDIVFNICEGIYGIGREAQVPCLLDAYKIPYTFSDPLVLSLTLNKGMTKSVIRDAGLDTPEFEIVYNEQDVNNVNLSYPMFVKPNGEGSGMGIDYKSKVNNKEELISTCKSIWETISSPLLIETYLSGREFTVGIVDDKVIGCMEVHFNGNENFYSYFMKTNYEDYITYSVPEKEINDKVCRLAINSWNVLGCRDSGRVDIRLDDNGVPNFIEINPLAGLNDKNSDLPILARLNGYDYKYIIENIMKSAKKRL